MIGDTTRVVSLTIWALLMGKTKREREPGFSKSSTDSIDSELMEPPQYHDSGACSWVKRVAALLALHIHHARPGMFSSAEFAFHALVDVLLAQNGWLRDEYFNVHKNAQYTR